MDNQIDALAKQVNQLQGQVRRMQIGGIAVVGISLALLAVQPGITQTANNDGGARGRLLGFASPVSTQAKKPKPPKIAPLAARAPFIIYGAAGQPIASIGEANDGSGLVVTYNAQGKPMAAFGTGTGPNNVPGGAFSAWNASDQRLVYMGAGSFDGTTATSTGVITAEKPGTTASSTLDAPFSTGRVLIRDTSGNTTQVAPFQP